MKKVFYILSVIMILSLMFSACAKPSETEMTTDETAADETVRLKTVISDLEQMVQIFQVDLNGLNTTMTQINELTSKFKSWTESIPAIQRSFSEPLNDLQSTMSNSKSQIETKSNELMTSLTDVKNKISPISEQLSILVKDLQSFHNFIEAINHTPAVKD